MNWEAIILGMVWPSVAVGLALIFRRQFGLLIGRIVTAKLPGGTELSFGASRADQKNEEPTEIQPANRGNPVDWRKVGNLYWLGHDVMWSIDVLLRGGGKLDILHGLKQSAHHASEIGMSVWAKRLEELHNAIAATPETDLTSSKRDEAGFKLRRISDQVGALAETQQTGYRGWPQAPDDMPVTSTDGDALRPIVSGRL
jgi:hypothetical protein